MNNRRIGSEVRVRAILFRGAQTKVRLLAVHEIARIKAIELHPELSRYQQEATGHDLDRADIIHVPTAIGFGEEPVISRDRVDAEGPAEHVPERHSLKTAGVVEGSVGKQCPSAPNLGVRFLFCKFDQPFTQLCVSLKSLFVAGRVFAGD